jgi:hypothetical protein
VGRQSGKTRIASALAVYEAISAQQDPGGGETYCLLVAQDHRAALRALFSYVTSTFDASEMLQSAVSDQTRDTITLESGSRIAAYPCRAPAVRGLRARIVVCDEIAFYRSSDGYDVGTEMLRALRPTLATTDGKLVMISSPYGQAGVLWEMHRKHYGRNESPVLVWQADAPSMNPTLPAHYLDQMKEDDPEAYRSEVLGEFRAGVATLFDPEILDDAVIPGRKELSPVDGITYRAFVDPSGGRRDAFSLAIGHRADGRVVVAALRAWNSPLNPSGVIQEAATLLRGYRISHVTGDRYGGEFPREAFRTSGIGYRVADKPKSDLYLGLLAAVNSRSVELLDDENLLRELRGLERRRGASGRDRVDHRPGSHDDRANAVAGLTDILIRRQQDLRKPRIIFIKGRANSAPRLPV